jgi:hypothetical protein
MAGKYFIQGLSIPKKEGTTKQSPRMKLKAMSHNPACQYIFREKPSERLLKRKEIPIFNPRPATKIRIVPMIMRRSRINCPLKS